MNWYAGVLGLLLFVMGWATGVMHERYVDRSDLLRFVAPTLIAAAILIAVAVVKA